MADKAVKKKPNIIVRAFTRVTRYLKDVRGEMKKVVWPSRKQVINNCIVVAVFVLGCAVLIGGLDLLFGWLFQMVIKLGSLAA